MNFESLKGQWQQMKGEAKRQWGKLTDDDLMEIDGNKDILIGKLQERYGYSRAQAEKDYDTFLSAQRSDRLGSDY